MKKSLIAVLAATIIMLSTVAPLLYIQTVKAADPTNWYTTVPGVLNSDSYSLYPFAKKSLTIGMSKFGEMIDANTKTGLSYGPEDLDPFANEGFVPEFEWNQGWLINITYPYSGEYRNVWAFALYSDSYSEDSIGGDWKRADDPASQTIVGGRKYGGYRYGSGTPVPIGIATTDPFTVLYNGPRRWVGLSKTTISESLDTPLVAVHITFVFDKVKKYVILYKDIKLLDTRKFTGSLQVEFSNRGEWDLGKATAPASYAHFFEDQQTVYSTGYHPFYSMPDNQAPPALYDVAQVISSSTPGYVGFAAFWPSLQSKWVEGTVFTDRTRMLGSAETYTAAFTGTGQQTAFPIVPPANPYAIAYPRGLGYWDDEPMVFVDGKIRPSDLVDPLGYTWYSNYDGTGVVVFNTPPGLNAKVWLIYKQLVDKVDMSQEPRTPYIIGEWDFDLSWASPDDSTNHFRGVTVYGVTDYHDATDVHMPYAYDSLDREVTYQLDEVFNPWDLQSAVAKKTSRWVDYSDDPIGQDYWDLENSPVLDVPYEYWDQYAVFSERVEDLTAGTVLNRWLGDYGFYVNETTGIGTIYGLNPTHQYKFLYSTVPYMIGDTFVADGLYGRYEWMVVGRDSKPVDSIGASLISAAFKDMQVEIGNAALDMIFNESALQSVPNVMAKFGTGNNMADYYKTNDPPISTPGYRTALTDDWCTSWPVSSSNLITTGGPLVNLLTYYTNDFAEAFYGINQYTLWGPWNGAVDALSCWSKHGYYSNTTTGYAAISTYLDINGTVVFSVWGVWGRDTFYASQWLAGDAARGILPGIWYLYGLNPGVTSIILQMDFTDAKHPVFGIVEHLGTISEKMPLHPDP